MADWICSIAATISSPQSKLMDISALPRLVVERRLRTPGTARTACSMGNVTSTIIRSAGRSPASILTMTLENPHREKSETGSLEVATTPPTTKTDIKNRSERRCA